MEKKLSRSLVNSTDIPAAITSLLKSTMESSANAGGSLPPMALRLKGQLLLGIVRIYVRKTRYLLEDCTEAVSKLRIVYLTNLLIKNRAYKNPRLLEIIEFFQRIATLLYLWDLQNKRHQLRLRLNKEHAPRIFLLI